ncbi:MAG: EAL domain-containing protein [Gammaproteobacteria bacterium]|nr:EAL domain-containing protein [Gammaproteobacteria bacterium]
MGEPIRLLIIEDSEDDAYLLVRELRIGGFQLHFLRTDTALETESALRRSTWDLVITDHNMPNFSAVAAMKLVKEIQPDTPVIIVSGSIGEEFAVQAMKDGAHDYLMKDNLRRLIPAVTRELRDAEIRRAHRRAEAEIYHLAFHDVLTGLVNRREFEHQLGQVLDNTRRDFLSHALLYLDLDQFKLVNDTCGHLAGDELLRLLAVLLQSHVRGNDVLARLGGDEFGILLKGCPAARAQQIASEIRQAIAGFRFAWEDKVFVIGVSIGLVMINADSFNVKDALSKADIACYTAKDQGRNRVHVYSETDAEAARRYGDMQWANRIRDALEEHRFVLYQQQIKPLGDVSGPEEMREFLVRMVGENGEIISPGAFIPAAEHYNMMHLIDRWVIDFAFGYLSNRQRQAPNRCELTFINLSGNSLNDTAFFEFVRERLDRYQVFPGSICFEITETAAISNLGRAIEIIRGIKSLGCHFALDDFGSGMSSFSYLRAIPVDYLKIDGSFVKNMVDDAMDCAIVEAINVIGQVAGLKTIAEFVENQAIWDKLHAAGVCYGQGYGIDCPRPLDDEEALALSSRSLYRRSGKGD